MNDKISDKINVEGKKSKLNPVGYVCMAGYVLTDCIV